MGLERRGQASVRCVPMATLYLYLKVGVQGPAIRRPHGVIKRVRSRVRFFVSLFTGTHKMAFRWGGDSKRLKALHEAQIRHSSFMLFQLRFSSDFRPSWERFWDPFGLQNRPQHGCQEQRSKNTKMSVSLKRKRNCRGSRGVQNRSKIDAKSTSR